MRNLTARQKSIIKLWVKKKYQKIKSDKFAYMYGVNFPSDPAEAMIEDGTYEILEKINDTEILYTEINRFTQDYYNELREKEH